MSEPDGAPREQAALTQQELEKLLLHSDTAILIGGSAVAFWAVYFEVPVGDGPRPYVSADADFLGYREHVGIFAKALGLQARYPSKRMITALYGEVVKQTPAGEIIAVDVVHKVVGLEAETVRRNAAVVPHPSDPGRFFRVMHPIDCLVSRLENLRKIQEKRNEVGAWQTMLSVQICRAYLKQLLAVASERDAIRGATRILKVAQAAAAIQSYDRYDIDVLDAIPLDDFRNEMFKDKQYARMTARIQKLRQNQPRGAPRTTMS